MKFAASLVVAIVFAAAIPAAAQSDRPGAPKSKRISMGPMVFYLAKGEPDSCGEGCSEWIAAEGEFDTGSAQRLRAILARLGKHKRPIFFHSPGGNGIAATTIGRLLRAREMTAGVSETIPEGCVGVSAQACRALKQSGQELPSELRNVAFCNSACVFALVGASVRQVPPGALLGVHSARIVVFRPDGRKVNMSDSEVVSFQKTKLAELNVQFRRYFQEMKADVRLFDLLSKVPHEKVHYLSRAEVVGFGIDAREFQEARWIATESMPRQLWAMKYFIEAKGEDHKALRTSVIRLECGNSQHVKIIYFRNLGPAESEAERTIKLATGNRGAQLARVGSALKVEAIESDSWFSVWGAYAPFEVFEAAAARETVEIVESEPTNVAPRITKLSTVGLSQAIAKLRGRCVNAMDCRLPSSWVAGALSPNCSVPFMNTR